MAEQPTLVQPIECQECPALWTDDSRWRAYLADEDGAVFYCAECAEREFGDD